MKKILIFLGLFCFLILPLGAETVMPTHVSSIGANILGVYQAGKAITLYDEPHEGANVVTHISWSGDNIFPENKQFSNVFLVYLPRKELALLAVTDETEEWVQVLYDNEHGLRGWMKKDDPYKFMSWISFYNIYGRKYGLYMLKDTPDSIKDLHSAAEDDSQVISHLNLPPMNSGLPNKIKLNVMRGNWALVSVMDTDKMPKTGYIRWRSNEGYKYLFPAIK